MKMPVSGVHINVQKISTKLKDRQTVEENRNQSIAGLYHGIIELGAQRRLDNQHIEIAGPNHNALNSRPQNPDLALLLQAVS